MTDPTSPEGTTAAGDPTQGAPSGELVSLADEVLSDPKAKAMIRAIAREAHYSEDELTEVVLAGWERGLRPLRSLEQHVRWDLIVRASNRHAGYEVRNPDPMSIDRKAFGLMSPEAMLRCQAIPLGFTDDGTVEVSVYDPTDTTATDEVEQWLRNYRVKWYIADGDAIKATISAIVSREEASEDDDEENTEAASRLLAVDDPADGPIVKLVDTIIQQAIALNASDIHLEPSEQGLVLKYRRDGLLITRDVFSRERGYGIINRFKTACEMPLERILPLDGRMEINIRGKRYDLRVVTSPTVWDMETVVIRLLATQQNLLDLDQLFPEAFLDRYNRLIRRPDGLILVVGRTGDGKPVSVDALVLMADGTRKRLGDVQVGDRVITHAGRARTVTAVHEQGRLPGVRIETVHGRVTTAALDHPFLTPDGWVEAQDLTAGMSLANVARPVIESTPTRGDAEFVLAGLLVGSGDSSGGTVTWRDRAVHGDDSVAKALFAACDALGFSYQRATHANAVEYALSRGIYEWLRDVGLDGLHTQAVRVPSFVHSGTPEQIALFVGAYLACDGTVEMDASHPDGPRLVGVACCASDRDRLADIQHLLLRLGIQSFLSADPEANVPNREPLSSWRLFIGHDNDACTRLATTVPVPGVNGELLTKHARPRAVFDERLLSDEVVTVNPVEGVECRCLTVDEDHTFTVDDLVVHNSTTLAATLNRISRPEVKTLTAEDPVEYKVPGVTQVEVNQKAGRDFPVMLRAFLRSDPDIIMVGEIRDAETGDIAVKAAQTGHLVLSTLHIRDVCGTPSRLVNMGIEPIMIAETLVGVLSQRLVRRLCKECAIPAEYTLDELVAEGWNEDWSVEDSTFFAPRPGGCSNCAETGYNGRIAVPELLVVHDSIRDMIAAGATASQIREVATRDYGMTSMREAALDYVRAGITSLDEINRVIQGSI